MSGIDRKEKIVIFLVHRPLHLFVTGRSDFENALSYSFGAKFDSDFFIWFFYRDSPIKKYGWKIVLGQMFSQNFQQSFTPEVELNKFVGALGEAKFQSKRFIKKRE